MGDDKITQPELAELFGQEMSIIAVKLLWTPDKLTVDDLRQILTALALPAASSEDVRAGALKEAEKALRDWQDSLNVQRMSETAVTIGMAADVVAALIPGAKP